jgi:formyltetrahydrofolate-dependent phosphoribosylglycinamide formyltransferase
LSLAPINLAVLISGSGTTLQNLIDEIVVGQLNACIPVVVASRQDIKGIQRAKDAGLKCVVVSRKQFADTQSFSREVFSAIGDVDLICLAGWLCFLDIPASYIGRVMNIHPALLPSFGGQGMYGSRVHQSVIDHGCKISGCTVHFVDGVYDNGPIILQRTCPVRDDDTAETLAHRVFEAEKIAYPEAIRLFQQGRLKISGRRVAIQSP